MKIGIVGSRTFPQPELVAWFVGELPKGVTVISGGAKGVDTVAKETAEKCGLEAVEYLPDLEGCKERAQFTERYFARNGKIAAACDLLVAFTEKDAGGTWNTIKQARQLGKPVKVMRPTLVSATSPAADEADSPTKEKRAAGREKGKGPFHLKRVGLGSFALRLKRYFDSVKWADFINAKDSDPERCAQLMLPAFKHFFEDYDFGKIHAITQAPKSVRRGDKPHPMDTVCREVADMLGVPYIELFEPWAKKSRGRMQEHPEIAVSPAVKDWVGKVVFVLDDVSTSNRTLKAAVGALNALQIHTHGLCYVQYA